MYQGMTLQLAEETVRSGKKCQGTASAVP